MGFDDVIFTAEKILSYVYAEEKKMGWQATTDLSRACSMEGLNTSWPGDGDEFAHQRKELSDENRKKSSMNFAKAYCLRALYGNFGVDKKKEEVCTAYNFVLGYVSGELPHNPRAAK